MKAFVTGGTGFIGSHLADRLIEDNQWDTVKCLVRSNEKWLKGKSFEKISGDLDSIRTIDSSLKDIDTIFHIAAIVKAPSKKKFLHANVQATENLIRLAKKNNVQKLVILSSLAAAGPSNGEPLQEDAEMKPVSMYGESKKLMEQMVHNLADDDMSVTILRPPAVYGPREDQIFTLFNMMSKGIAPIIGDGENPKLSILFVHDLVQAIIKASEQSEKGVHTYFISGDRITNWNEIKDIVSTVLDKKTIALKIRPSWVKKIAGALETTAALFGSYPILNREKANEMILTWTCSHEKAAKELSYKPEYTLEEGISRTLRWYKKHNWL